MKIKLILLFYCLSFLQSCAQKELTMYDVELFKNTPIWLLAKAVDSQDTIKIQNLIKEDKLYIDYQDPIFDRSLLMWSIFNGKYESFKKLLSLGANPNIVSKYDGETPMTYASNYFKNYKIDSRYLKDLLKAGGNPELVTFNKENNNVPVEAIYYAVTTSLEYTKLLIDAGVDVNHKTGNYSSILESAILQEKIDIVYYLVEEKGAKTNLYLTDIDGKKYPLVELLRYWVFPLNSKEYRMKMTIVDVFKRNGQDYWSIKIPKKIIKNIKQDYPNNWEEYMKIY